MAATKARVWVFGKGHGEGDKSMKALLGGKGANLAEMSRIGLSVPPGLTVTTEACEDFHKSGSKLTEDLWQEILVGLKTVEKETGFELGNPANPLLVSVRSGAAVSMPGMMDTVLNLGLNDDVVAGLAKKSNERFAYDSYRRFIDMFGDVVMNVSHSLFEAELAALKKARGAKQDTDLNTADLKELVERYKAVYRKGVGKDFPSDPLEQLRYSVMAVFNSWNSNRAIKYRTINKVTGLKGTAVNVQAMVFGNMGDSSGTGVLFTRSPSNGQRKLYGEYLINAQGEDVVAGIRTPEDIETMKKVLPKAYEELCKNCEILEKEFKEMMDIEFTVQEGNLWMLQCRTGKRTGLAAVKIAVDMVAEGLVTPRQAILMVEPRHLDQLLHPQFADPKAYKPQVLGTGLPASPGAAVGQVVFHPEDAEAWKAQGKDVILVRMETSPEDVGGMHAASGILTARGGMTSHAAVVARGWGKCCVAGCQELHVDEHNRTMDLGGKKLKEGEWISLNGTTGEVIMGQQKLAPPSMSGDLSTFMKWVDETRKLKVMANADTPEDATGAREKGAEGIGLCRTEHMFFASDERIKAVRQMIVATTPERRHEAIDKLLPYQRSDFEGIFRAMDGLPVTIRLLDPPLHEFLPNIHGSDHEHAEHAVDELVRESGVKKEDVLNRIEELQEVNPMLGFRGCRLGIGYEDLSEMQVRAIFQAAAIVQKEGKKVHPEIMVPLVGTTQEFEHQEAIVRKVIADVAVETGVTVPFMVGTMIEVPRAALIADQIAERAEFFSFGTNDLTQMTFGYSRDDVSKFLPKYLELGILQSDPFEVLDQAGVGQLIQMAVERGRKSRPDLPVGVCGEQGGEASSVEFFAKVGLNYVSCSPFRYVQRSCWLCRGASMFIELCSSLNNTGLSV
eukprot:TRINITY_DN24389_c0_g2_i3.p1 TRINITY_DN24389_c0_g2~~TRINITY_DN24389_c0_g2_i3.p1  ORF type:complete len:901 (+),score=96.56 TRINITY_DN24389_c0_g2_i3:114-2816(+)